MVRERAKNLCNDTRGFSLALEFSNHAPRLYPTGINVTEYACHGIISEHPAVGKPFQLEMDERKYIVCEECGASGARMAVVQ